MEDLGTECEKLVWDQASLNGVIRLPMLLSLYNVEKEVTLQLFRSALEESFSSGNC